MNLPCPLVSYVRMARPPLAFSSKQPDTVQIEAKNESSSSESEIEIDQIEQDSAKRVPNEQINRLKPPKRLKIQSYLKSNEKEDTAVQTNKLSLNEVFENQTEKRESNKLTSNKPSTYDRQVVRSEGSGFAKILPIAQIGLVNSIGKTPEDAMENVKLDENLLPGSTSDYVTLKELEKNRMKIAELKELPVYKNYEKGAISTRLYIKNLAKNVEDSHLKHIYGRYVDWQDEASVNAFDIRLMKEGRMKGQAFVTFSNEQSAEIALTETNGYLLCEKPLVVSFARSAKSK